MQIQVDLKKETLESLIHLRTFVENRLTASTADAKASRELRHQLTTIRQLIDEKQGQSTFQF